MGYRPPVIHHSGGGKFAIRADDCLMIEEPGSGEFTDPGFPASKPGAPEGQPHHMKEDPQEKENVYLYNSKKVEELINERREIRAY